MRYLIKWLVFLLLFSSFPAFGEEGNVGILVKGPEREMGFPYIYPNALETWSGFYRYLYSDIEVYFTRGFILLPAEWEKHLCGKISGFVPEGNVFFYQDTSWSLLFLFSLNESNLEKSSIVLSLKEQCSFVDKFIPRLKYLLRDSNVLDPPLLPAILEFP
ncbi:MAG: hypothetical protein DRP58_12165 [Spirochaetes bacterium]|nr:MAG: hypothetical protein DRP58_12165 [Spirochaetota bacterium]